MVVDYKDIGKRIRTLRKKRMLSQEQLAEMVNVGTGHISHIENGNTKMSMEVFVRICNALGASADYMLSNHVYETKPVIENNIAGLLKTCTWEELRFFEQLIADTKPLLQQYRQLNDSQL